MKHFEIWKGKDMEEDRILIEDEEGKSRIILLCELASGNDWWDDLLNSLAEENPEF
jgi:hypothetical protein